MVVEAMKICLEQIVSKKTKHVLHSIRRKSQNMAIKTIRIAKKWLGHISNIPNGSTTHGSVVGETISLA